MCAWYLKLKHGIWSCCVFTGDPVKKRKRAGHHPVFVVCLLRNSPIISSINTWDKTPSCWSFTGREKKSHLIYIFLTERSLYSSHSLPSISCCQLAGTLFAVWLAASQPWRSPYCVQWQKIQLRERAMDWKGLNFHFTTLSAAARSLIKDCSLITFRKSWNSLKSDLLFITELS